MSEGELERESDGASDPRTLTRGFCSCAGFDGTLFKRLCSAALSIPLVSILLQCSYNVILCYGLFRFLLSSPS